jgi:hypothetical protein
VIAVLFGQGYRPKRCCRILGVAPGGYFGWISSRVTLLWCVKRHEVAVYILGNVPPQASDDLSLGAALLSTTSGMLPDALVMAHPRDGDDVERAVDLTAGTTVEPMALGLAGGCGDRRDTAKMPEGCFRPQSVWAITSCLQQLAGDLDSHTRKSPQPWCSGTNQLLNDLLKFPNLHVELLPLAG